MNNEENVLSKEVLPNVVVDKAERTFSLIECVYSFVIFLLAFGFAKFVVFTVTGYITTFLYAAIITAVIVFLRKSGCVFTRLGRIMAVVLYLFSTVFSITDNDFIKTLDVIFLFVGGAYFVYSVGGGNASVDRFLPFAVKKSLLEYPFSSFGVQFSAMKTASKSSRFGNNIRLIVIGLVLTVPLTALVASLLMSADSGVEKILKSITNTVVTDNAGVVFCELLIAVPCGCYLYGMLYSSVHREDVTALDDAECEEKTDSMRFVENVILYTAVTPLIILYVMFFISQANYFLSAFAGRLPSDGMLYSEYARRGFFELTAIAVINLTVIISLNLFSKRSGKQKPVALKIYSITLCIFTLVMIAVAMSKMAMYISVYGLTRLRLYTTWFMLLCAVFFIMLIIRQLRPSFRIAQWGTIAFTVMFGILCFSRPDALIARCNIAMYNSGMINQLDTDELLEMSCDSVYVVLSENAADISDAERCGKNGISSNISANLVERLMNDAD